MITDAFVSAGFVMPVCVPGTVVVELSGTDMEPGAEEPGTVIAPPEVEGTLVTVWLSVVRAVSTEPGLDLTFTERLSFVLGSFRPIIRKMNNRRSPPIATIGMIAHFGNVESSLTTLETTFLSTTGRAWIGRPQLGQAIAVAEISCPHSGQ